MNVPKNIDLEQGERCLVQSPIIQNPDCLVAVAIEPTDYPKFPASDLAASGATANRARWAKPHQGRSLKP